MSKITLAELKARISENETEFVNQFIKEEEERQRKELSELLQKIERVSTIKELYSLLHTYRGMEQEEANEYIINLLLQQ